MTEQPAERPIKELRTVTSEELLRGERELLVDHNGAVYKIGRGNPNKLILAIAKRSKSQRRRRLLLIIAFILMLPGWYVGAWLAASAAFGYGYIPNTHGDQVAAPFKPLIAYANSDYYGARSLRRAFCLVMAKDMGSMYGMYRRIDKGADMESMTFRLGPLSPDLEYPLIREVATYLNGEERTNASSPHAEASANSDPE